MKSLHNKLFEGFYKNAGGMVQPRNREELLREMKLRIDQGQTNLNDIDTSRITDMSYLFRNLNRYPEKIDISLWDVSNVRNMAYMFQYYDNFNCDLSKWDVSNVTDTHGLFFQCTNFNSDLSKWDVSKVTDMRSMFYECPNFNCDLSGWNVNKVRYMDRMFKKSGIKERPSWYKEYYL